MDRRTFLGSCGVAATISLAGCGGTGESDENGSTPTDDGPTPTDDGSTGVSTSEQTVVTTSGSQPRLVGQSIATDETSCGTPDGSATVGFAPGDGSVSIEGVIGASTPCHAATLSSVDYDDASDTLTVTIGVESTAQACQECTGRLEYRASLGFIGGLPGRVVVAHGAEDPQTVADVRR